MYNFYYPKCPSHPDSSPTCSNCDEKLCVDDPPTLHQCNSHGHSSTPVHATQMLKPVHPHQTFRCPKCGEMPSTYRNLVLHMRTHEAVFYSCAMCQRTFQTFQLLGHHLQVDHSAPYASPCTICNNYFLNRSQLEAHIRTMHPTTLYLQCGICSKTFTNKLLYLNHIESSHAPNSIGSTQPLTCNLCGRCFTTDSELDQHMGEQHVVSHEHNHIAMNIPQYDGNYSFGSGSDDICGVQDPNNVSNARTHSSDQLNEHEEPYQCNSETALSSELFSPIEQIDGNISISSEQSQTAPEPARSSSSLSERHPCQQCGISFQFSEMLTEHMQTHSPSHTKLHGNKCEQTFNSMVLLNIHVVEQHKEAQHVVTSNISPLPQFDGTYEDSDTSMLSIPQASHLPLPGSSSASVSNVATQNTSANFSVLHVPYQLNQQKQLNNLVRDSKIVDYDITTNDNDRNVIIQCSVGFFEAVAKPALSSLSSSFSHSVSGISIQCTVVRKSQDLNQSTPGLLL